MQHTGGWHLRCPKCGHKTVAYVETSSGPIYSCHNDQCGWGATMNDKTEMLALTRAN